MSFENDNQANADDLAEKLKAARKAECDAKKELRKADAYSSVSDWVKDTPIYFVAAQDMYVLKKEDNNWEFLKPSALPRRYPILKDKNAAEALTMAMEEQDRQFLNVTYTFHPERYPQTLNLLEVTDWLKPLNGKHHWAFDVLIQSLGSNKQENMEHIKHVIAFKYEHPDCFLLPCMVFFGEGRVGKNVLVDAVLYTIFSGRTVSALADFVIGDFNSMLKGKVVCCVNETMVGKHDRSRLYDTLMKERVPINEKQIRHYEIDNTSAYIIGSNDWTGGTQLDRGASDDRLSIMRCEKGKRLRYWVGQHLEINEHEAQQWLFTEGRRIFSDPAECAKWLNYLLENYGGREQPVALHGEDYRKVMDVQQKLDEDIMRAVFTDEAFEYISVLDLHEGYILLCKERGQMRPIGLKLFNQRVEMWFEDNMPNVTKLTKKINYYEDDGLPSHMKMHKQKTRKQREKTVWVNSNISCQIEHNNREKYIEGIGYQKTWVGPEIM